MSKRSVQSDSVRKALTELGERVRTKEVSNHPAMLAAHPELSGQRNYHAWVGSFLSECPDVQRVDVPHNRSGALWQNLLSGGDASPPIPQSDASGSDGVGPQCSSDQPFTARMRLHQSWYRAHVLNVPCGTGPEARSITPYGNMLRREDAERGLNFITPEIFQVARRRLAQRTGVVAPFRLLRNMLSSQPLCFNLFAPLAADLDLATRLVCALPGLSARRALSVALEHTPGDQLNYLDDGTAFDAYLEYEQVDGQRAFLGVEVKLTEPFSQKVCDSPAYRRWMTGPRAPWRPDAGERVAALQHNQLWRDHLLAIAHRDASGSPFASGRLMLVRHPGDRSCERIVGAYGQLLREGDDSVIDMPLDRLLELWREAVQTEAQRAWLSALAERYLELDKSLPLWAAQARTVTP